MKRLVWMMALCLPLCGFASGAKAASALPPIHGQYGVAIDAHTGDVLYGKNEQEKAYPASTTKILTAVLLDEHVKEGEWLEVSENAAGQEASNGQFKVTAGEKITKEHAMNALMILSSNDVAMAIAEHVGGSAEGFAKMMNEKAVELGAENTHFETPNGLHSPNHYTTAYDMALITKEAMKYPLVMEAMGTKKAVVETDKQELEITNPSKIHDNPLALGGKTGYTNAAQNTLVEVLQKEKKTVIAVVMKTTLAEEYKDIEIMGEHAFSQMASQKVVDKGAVVSVMEFGNQEVRFITDDEFYLSHKNGEKTEITKNIVRYNLEGNQRIEAGQEIGKMEILKDGTVIEEIPLISDAAAELPAQAERRISGAQLLVAIAVPFAAYVLFVVYYNVRKRKEQIRALEKRKRRY